VWVLGLGGSRLVTDYGGGGGGGAFTVTLGGRGAGGGGTTWLDLVALDCSGVSGSGYQEISRVVLAAV
jgi:hypothetical protein